VSRIRYEDLDQDLIDQLAREACEEAERKRYRDLEAALRHETARIRVGDVITLAILGAFCLGSWWLIFKGVKEGLTWLLNL